MRSQASTPIPWRDHIGGEIAALCVLAVAGVAVTAWRASRTAEAELNARTRTRLLPPRARAAATSEAP